MRSMQVGLALLACVLLAGCSPSGSDPTAGDKNVLLRVHFAGRARLNAASNAAKLKSISALPASSEFWNKAAARLAVGVPQLLNLQTAPGQTNWAPLLSPLFEDVWQQESFLEVMGPETRKQALLAVALPENRVAVWTKNLESLKAAAPGQVHYSRSGSWMLVRFGKEAAGNLSVPPFKEDHWLEADINLPVLAPSLALPVPGNTPFVNLTLSSREDSIRMVAKLSYRDALNWRPDPWQLPTNTIREPLISFTAANGVSAWLASTKLFQQLQLKPVPNQFSIWGIQGMPFLTYFAVPTKDCTNVLQYLAQKLPPVAMAATAQGGIGTVYWASNRAEVVWQGLPMMSPYLRPGREAAGEFIIGGLVPLAQKGSNPPRELLGRVQGRKDLVYYDWEITQARIECWRQYFLIAPLFTEMRQVPRDYPAQKWLMDATPLLANTVTEVTYVSPKELNLVRKGHLGLTGFELAVLTRWFDGIDLPADFGRLHPRPKDPRPKAQPSSTTPATRPKAK